MSTLKVNEIQIFNGTTVTITATTTETSADLNVGADLDVTGALTLGTALAVAEGGTGATDATTARTNLDVDQAGTDNSTDVTLITASHDYLSIAGQAITLGPIDLAADVTGSLPYASISGTPTLATVATSGAYSDLSGTPTLGTAAAEDVEYFATAAQGTLADSATQPGDDANTLGSGSATDGYVLTADGAGGAAWEAASGGAASLPIDLLSSSASIRKSDGSTAVLSESGGTVTLENTSLGDTVLMPDNSNNVSTAPGIRFEADTDTGIALASAGNLAIVTGGSERMRIDNSGRLLAGTSGTSSISRSVIQGAAGADHGILYIARNSAPPSSTSLLGSLLFSDNGHTPAAAIECRRESGTWTSGSSQPTYLYFSTTADGSSSMTERMRVSARGQMSAFSDTTFIFSSARTNAAQAIIAFQNNSSSILTGTDVLIVRADGDVENTNNRYGGFSDIKLKENIVDANSQWNDIKNLQVRKYNFKSETGYDTHTQIGLIAQEVELVSPGLVSESPDCDAEGNDLGTVTKSVSYSVLYMKAVKALQEAMERIEILEVKIDALETRIQALEV